MAEKDRRWRVTACKEGGVGCVDYFTDNALLHPNGVWLGMDPDRRVFIPYTRVEIMEDRKPA